MLQRARASVSLAHRAAAVVAAIALAMIGLVAAAPASSAAGTRTISGTFTVPSSGIESWWDETVFISAQGIGNDAYANATVDTAAKTFTITGLEPGTYALNFTSSTVDHDSDGYWESSNLVGGDYQDGAAVDVTAGNVGGITYAYAAGKTVSGTVTLGAGADPSWINDVEASVSIPGPDGCQCGDSFAAKVNPTTGAYVIRGLPDRSLTVAFGPKYNSDANLIPEYYSNSYTWEGATQLNFAAGSYANIDATLEVGRTISGTVALPGGVAADALKGIDVQAEGDLGQYRHAEVDPTTGAYTVFGLIPDSFTLHFQSSNWSDESFNTVYTPLASVYYGGGYTQAGSTKVNVTAGNAAGRDQTMIVGRTISGNVTLGSGIDPAWMGALYTYAESEGGGSFRSAKVDPATGNYTVKGLAPASYTVSFDGGSLWNGSEYLYDDFAYEYYNNQRSPYSANLVSVSAANAVSIDAIMDLQVGNRTFWITPTPTVTGTAAVGSTLTAVTGTWEPYASTFTYQWLRDGVPVGGATAKTFAVTQADAGHQLTVAVTGARTGYTAVTKTSAATPVPLTAFTTAPTPTITGAFVVGQSLTAVPGTWSPVPGFTYQWTRNGSPIASATSASYTLVAADAGATVSVTVTGTLAGYASASRSATGQSVGTAPFATAPIPTVTGEFVVWQLLSAVPGSWSPQPAFTYQWTRNGNPIANAIGSTYQLVPADAGATVAVTVTGALSGYPTTARNSAGATVGLAHFASTPTPTIEGSLMVGLTPLANPGVWSPEANLTYQWTRDGEPIAGATNASYTLVAGDVGTTISVTVTGTSSGYVTVSRPAMGATATAATFLSTPAPVFETTFRVGNSMHAADIGWDPQVSSYSYQWLRNGTEIPGATTEYYTATAADYNQAISLRVTGHRAGHVSVTVTSATTVVTAGIFATTPTPTISGSTYPGATLKANPGSWAPEPSGFTYQWYRSGVAVAGATGSTYKLTSYDSAKKITVKVTGTRAGFTSVSKTSASLTLAKFFTKTGTAAISGTVKVGSTVKASVGTWSPTPTSYSYQWYRDGLAISGATKSSYTLTGSSAGKKLTVKITGKRTGYASTPKTSAAKTVASGTFSSSPTPRISGTAKVGYTLTVTRGTWSPTPSTYSYQWYRSGTAISGATATKYKLLSADKGKTITVKVTARKTGYTTTARTSVRTATIK